MTFTPDHIERQIELTQLAGFDSHIHIDADGSARVVLDAIEAVQRRYGRGTAHHTVCHNTTVHPDDVKRFAELGVIANCTLLWGTDYDGTFYDTYLAKLGADRMEERLYPYGDLVRSGALVTYGSDIPGVRIGSGHPGSGRKTRRCVRRRSVPPLAPSARPRPAFLAARNPMYRPLRPRGQPQNAGRDHNAGSGRRASRSPRKVRP